MTEAAAVVVEAAGTDSRVDSEEAVVAAEMRNAGRFIDMKKQTCTHLSLRRT